MHICCFCWPGPTTAKEPSNKLPGLELYSFLFMFLPPHPFYLKERKVGLPVASIPSESSVRYTAHVPSLPPSEKQPACLRAQDGNLSAQFLPYYSDGPSG